MLALRSLASLGDGTPVRVLDAGAGDGLLALAIAERHPAWTVVAADVREDALERGRADADRDGIGNVRFEQLDLTRPIPEGGYDVVLALECLEEIADDEAATAAFAGALRPDGLLLVHVPERDWKPVLGGSEATWRDEVRHGYTRDELVALLERHGLHVLRVTPTTRGTVRLAQEVRDRIKTSRLAVRAAAYPSADGSRSGSSGSASRGGRPARSTRRRGSRREEVSRPRGGRAGRAGRSAELLGR